MVRSTARPITGRPWPISHKAVAIRLLKRRLGEIGQGRPVIGRAVERTTFDDLAEMLLTDYRVNGRRLLERIEAAIEHLRSTFATARAVAITTDRITTYVGPSGRACRPTRRSTENWLL